MKVYFVFFFIFSIYNKSANADEIQNLLSRVRDLRLEVESINKDINSQRELNQSYIQTQSIRKAELDSEIQKSIEVKQNLIVEDKKIKTIITKSEFDRSQLKNDLLDQLDKHKLLLKSQVPFKLNERINAIDKMKLELENKKSPVKVLSQYWIFLLDELSLLKDVSLHRQTILIGNEERLSETIKLGMALMYFQSGNIVGISERDSSDHWNFTPLKDSSEIKKVEIMFANYKKNIRDGEFGIVTGDNYVEMIK